MPMLMIKCKTCGEVFGGQYVDEGKDNQEISASAATANTSHTCSRTHNNEYILKDYMGWS
jgi:hypothetical protein